MSGHPEKVGHCAECAAEIVVLREQLEAAELRLEATDNVLARHIRETEAVPATLPTDVTAPARKA